MATVTVESRGMENTFSEVHGTMQLVSFTLGKELYGIEITKVREIILIAEITRIPETPHFLKGLINLRSTVIPVIDLRARFGLPEGDLTDESRIMVLQACGKTIGIIVDAVSEVLRVKQDLHGHFPAKPSFKANNSKIISVSSSVRIGLQQRQPKVANVWFRSLIGQVA